MKKRSFPNPVHFFSFDAILPWAGVLVAQLFAWSEDMSEGEKEPFFTFIVPLGLCLLRAGIGTPQMKLDSFKSCPRSQRVVHQVLFAAAVLVLFFFEVFAAMLSYARGDEFVAWVVAGGFYGLYLYLIVLSNRAIRVTE